MSGDYKLIPTTREVYGTIYAEHCSQFQVFATISQPNGNPHGDPERAHMYTEWGFKGCDFPTIAVEKTWQVNREDPSQRVEYDIQYFICVARDRSME